MAKKEKLKTDLSTEEKIKAAARKVFTQKGYSATRTRDIAEEAGLNLALLNYYFRSKEKLFELIMAEKMQQFFGVRAFTDYLHLDRQAAHRSDDTGQCADFLGCAFGSRFRGTGFAGGSRLDSSLRTHSAYV